MMPLSFIDNGPRQRVFLTRGKATWAAQPQEV